MSSTLATGKHIDLAMNQGLGVIAHAARGLGDCRLRMASSPVKPPAATSPHPVAMVDTCIRPSAAPIIGPPRRSITYNDASHGLLEPLCLRHVD
jgi:hypothetical protein